MGLIDFFTSISEILFKPIKGKTNTGELNFRGTETLLEDGLEDWYKKYVLFENGTLREEFQNKEFLSSKYLLDLARKNFLAHEILFDFKWEKLDHKLKIYFFQDLIKKINNYTKSLDDPKLLKKVVSKIIKDDEARPRVDYLDWIVLFQILMDVIYTPVS